MANARKQHTATLLPDGRVLVTGGSRGTESANDQSTDPAFAAEVYDPATNQWQTWASFTRFRGYHSTALLLPDGRILSAGGDYGGPSAEVFSPPYLNGGRPTITAAPASAAYGQTFSVSTPQASGISKVTIISLSSVTHAFNQNQRINKLNFTKGSGVLNVTAPPNSNVCPPGYYMLFVLDAAGAPSVAKMIRIGGTAPAGTTPSIPGNLNAIASSSTQINLIWTDTSNNESEFKIERSTNGGSTFSLAGRVGANVQTFSDTGLTPSTTYHYRVRSTNAFGDSNPSGVDAATTRSSSQTLRAPSDLRGTASGTRITLTWRDNSDNEQAFLIERSRSGSGFTQVASVAANSTRAQITVRSRDRTYNFRVRARRGSTYSPYSNTVSVRSF
jgi:hypothetical protein